MAKRRRTADVVRQRQAVERFIRANERKSAKLIRLALRRTSEDGEVDAKLDAAVMSMLSTGVIGGRRIAQRFAPDRLRSAARDILESGKVSKADGTPTGQRGAKWAKRYSAELVKDISKSTRRAIRRVIVEGQELGLHSGTVKKLIKGIVGLDERRARAVLNFSAQQIRSGKSESAAAEFAERYASKLLTQRAEVIARTEMSMALQQGRTALWQEMVDEGTVEDGEITRVFFTVGDGAVDPDCLALDGVTAGLNEDFPHGAGHAPPIHPNCVVGETVVLGPKTDAVMSRWFQGDLITIRTASGKQITVTPNHPILTGHGWVPANRVNEVGNVLCLRSGWSAPGAHGTPRDDYVPSRIEDVSHALVVSGGMTPAKVPVSSPHFHGDGVDGEIDIVFPNSFLEGWLDSLILQELMESAFQGRTLADTLSTSCEPDSFLLGDDTPFGGFMRSSHLRRSLGLCHSGPFDALAVGVPTLHAAGSTNARDDRTAASAEELGNGIDGFPGFMQREHVVGIDVREVGCQVFNLQTAGGWYAASGIVTHNCRCDILIEVE